VLADSGEDAMRVLAMRTLPATWTPLRAPPEEARPARTSAAHPCPTSLVRTIAELARLPQVDPARLRWRPSSVEGAVDQSWPWWLRADHDLNGRHRRKISRPWRSPLRIASAHASPRGHRTAALFVGLWTDAACNSAPARRAPGLRVLRQLEIHASGRAVTGSGILPAQRC